MKIRQLIDYDRMKEYFNAPVEWFYQFGAVTPTPDGPYIFQSAGAHVLSVAHLDSVNPYDHFYVNNFAGNDIVFSTRLDDRLGAYVILELLPAMGIHADILLTVGEEVGKSTAAHFTTTTDYKWMYSFDRRGTDVVHYRYNDNTWLNALKVIWKTQVFHGSNSDIDYLHFLGCCGVNVGVGYHGEHDLMAFASMNELVKQLGRFVQFYNTNKRTTFKFVPPPPVKYTPPPATTLYSPPSYRGDYFVETYDDKDDDKDAPFELFNPYEGMAVDMPLDLLEYVDAQGVITAPDICSFCLEKLTDKNVSDIFMGICSKCEPFAVQCTHCNEYFCRPDVPTEDMADELFFGTCVECARNTRLSNTNETDRLQSDNRGGEREDNDDPCQGNEGNPAR